MKKQIIADNNGMLFEAVRQEAFTNRRSKLSITHESDKVLFDICGEDAAAMKAAESAAAKSIEIFKKMSNIK